MKKFWQSKTFWIAILTVLLGTLEFVEGQMTTGATLSAIGIINVFLRLVTKEAVALEL